jgi:hypothetical protein
MMVDIFICAPALSIIDNILGDTDEDLDALIEQEVQDAQNLVSES